MKASELLQKFYTDLILVKRDSEQTALTYKISAEEFLKWILLKKISLKAVTIKHLMCYLINRKEEGCSEVTISKDISGLRAFGDYLVRKHYWTENLALILDKPKAGKALPKVLSVEQIDLLLSGIDTSTLCGKRDDALFELI